MSCEQKEVVSMNTANSAAGSAEEAATTGSEEDPEGYQNPHKSYRPNDSMLRFRGTNAPYRDVELMVLSNRGDEVLDGFRGEVHPLVAASEPMSVEARWSPIGPSSKLHKKAFTQPVVDQILALKPHEWTRLYSPADFSALLPEDLTGVGQTYALDPAEMPRFLSQFHDKPIMEMVSEGRVVGQNGAYGIVRALSADHAEVLFRIHAEFEIGAKLWYTPAYLDGRLLVDLNSKAVQFFHLENPDLKLNVHVTSAQGSDRQYHQIVQTDVMELVGGNAQLLSAVKWTNQIEEGEAFHQLASQFYKFLDIDWVPLEQGLAQAKAEDRPLLAIVLKGGLDDQSC
jgi:hypothetical protein